MIMSWHTVVQFEHYFMSPLAGDCDPIIETRPFRQAKIPAKYHESICWHIRGAPANSSPEHGIPGAVSSLVHMVLAETSLISSQTLVLVGLTYTLASSSVSRLHPRVMQFVPTDTLMKSS